MATWQEVGIENFRTGAELYEVGRYRSAVSRFYYAIFSIVTYELIQRNATGAFRDGRATPGHSQLPRLVETYFTHFSQEKLANLIRYINGSYADRIAADYTLQRSDKQSARESYTAAEKIFRYIGVNHERKRRA